MNTAQLRAAIEAGDEQAARLRAALAQQLSQGPSDSRAAMDAANLLLEPSELEIAISITQERCTRLQDAVSVIEAHFQQRLTAEQERRFALQMHEMASRTGDVVGRLDNTGGYAVAMPWTEEEQATQLAQVLQNMAAYAAPDLACVVAHQTLRDTKPRPNLVVADSRLPARAAPQRSMASAARTTLSRANRR